jgi:hypothetical protein
LCAGGPKGETAFRTSHHGFTMLSETLIGRLHARFWTSRDSVHSAEDSGTQCITHCSLSSIQQLVYDGPEVNDGCIEKLDTRIAGVPQ